MIMLSEHHAALLMGFTFWMVPVPFMATGWWVWKKLTGENDVRIFIAGLCVVCMFAFYGIATSVWLEADASNRAEWPRHGNIDCWNASPLICGKVD